MSNSKFYFAESATLIVSRILPSAKMSSSNLQVLDLGFDIHLDLGLEFLELYFSKWTFQKFSVYD